jgi:hypothetical protein
MLRANITANQHREIRVLAARKGITAAELVARALRTSPATRAAFQEETK